MNILSLLGGALALRTETFQTLRDNADVFRRGFVLMLLVAILVGIFDAAVPKITDLVHPTTERQVVEEILRGIESSGNGSPVVRLTAEPYIREGVAMGFAIANLPPNAGKAFGPVARFLEWVGAVLARPFSFGFMGYFLLAALVVHLCARWLGGRAGMAQMLGLAALSYAPQIFSPVSSLLVLAENLTRVGAFGAVNALLGFAIFVWGVVIYVKATSVAQGLTYGRAVGVILLALLLSAIGLAFVACLVGALVAGGISTLVSATQ